MSSGSGEASSLGKRDVGWNHGSLVNSEKPLLGIRCHYCSKVTKGGISRHKQHLAGGYRNAVACKKVPPHVKEEIKGIMQAKQVAKEALDAIPKIDAFLDEESEEEKKNKGKRSASLSDIQISQYEKPKKIGPINTYFKKDHEATRHKLSGEDEVNAKKKLRQEAIQKFSQWMYDAAISFNAVNYLDTLKDAFEAIGQFGPGMKPPTFHEVRVKCLKEEVKRINKLMRKHEAERVKTGCSIMCDTWSNRKGRKLLNFMVNTARGSVFMGAIDISNVSCSAGRMYLYLDKFIQKVGEQNILQIVTDSAGENKKAGKILMKEYEHLYWTPCAAHCMDLILEDIFKMPDLKGTVVQAISVSSFIYHRPQLLSMLRQYTGGKELIKFGKTRFVTTLLMLKSFYRYKKQLKEMFRSETWINSKFYDVGAGKRAHKIILTPAFWNSVAYCVKFGGPLIEVLRLVHGEKKPAMGYIYKAMDRAKEQIEKIFGGNVAKYEEIFAIIDQRWDVQLHQPLHAAGHYLNPEFFYKNENIEQDEEIMKGLNDCIERLNYDPQVGLKILQELSVYKNAEGNFGSRLARVTRSTLQADVWWARFGSSAPNLQNFAIRILSLTCRSSGCGRNWSVFEHIHSKKRNRLERQHLNELVYVKFNRALEYRYSNRDCIDPIMLEKGAMDLEENEWMTGRLVDEDDEDKQMFDEDDLQLGGAGNAVGVYEDLYTFRARGSQSNTDKGKDKSNVNATTSTTKFKGKGKATTVASSSNASPRLDDEDDFGFDTSDNSEEEEDFHQLTFSSDDDDGYYDDELEEEDGSA